MKKYARHTLVIPALRVAASAAISLLLVSLTHAQTASNTAAPDGTNSAAAKAPASTPLSNAAAAAITATGTDQSSSNEQVVHLNPFEVTASKTVGYQAFQTLAGTRIRTNLADVGASISVITPEFLQDVGATDNGTLLEYTPNAQVASPEGFYAGVGNGVTADESGLLEDPLSAQRIRGLAAADNARNFYITDIPWDSYNVDRISILRGPNSILYGLGSPAGMINATTKQADFANHGEVTFRTGSYGSNRATVDINQQLIPNVLAVRVDGLWDDQMYEQKPAFDNDKRVYGTVRFDPKLFRSDVVQTDLKVNFEHGDDNANRPRLIPPNNSITPWFNPVAVSASNPFGGMGRALVNNPYDPYNTNGVVAGNGLGSQESTTVNYQPWESNGNDYANQQQPMWLIDGQTNHLIAVNGGYINTFAIDSAGNYTGGSVGLVGKNQNGMFFGLTPGGLSSAVQNYNAWEPGTFPLAPYGQYKTQSLLNPSVFDFYHILIDGPTSSEWQHWNAYDVDLTETAFDNRIGFELTYDRQKFTRGINEFLGGSPTLSIDILKNEPDFYLTGANGTTSVTNPDLGRPFVASSGGGGGNTYSSDREVRRASLFGELRASDFLHNSFLVKLLGKHRFNVVGSDEKYFNETRSWQNLANSQAWDGYWNGNAGNNNAFTDRPPVAIVYLGSPIINRASASGANIPGIATNITLPNSGVYVFDPAYQNYAVSYSAPWDVPSSLYSVFSGLPAPGATTQLYQNSNPANLVGWNSNFQDDLLRYNNGQDLGLLTNAEQSLRETISYSGSYQGFLWNDAVVATLGWRYDEVKTKDDTAQSITDQRGILNLSPEAYNIAGGYPHSQIFKGHSTSGGLVLHLNKFLPHNPLPVNISLSYNESSNFQVTSVRRDIYGNPIGNPTGKTYEYGVMLSTKNNKYTLRVVKYKTEDNNAASTLSNAYLLGSTIQQGLRWRNVFLYQLGVYTMDTANQPSYRNTWTNAYPNDTAAQAQADEDAAITEWNNIQTFLAGKGFFQAWNFTPLGPTTALVDRTTYLSDPAKYAPDPSTVSAYVATAPQGFTVTADTVSKGYEYEFIANPLPNWRMEINASETTAVQNNVGGATLDQFVSYVTSQLYQNGAQTPAGELPQYGGAGNSIYLNQWAPFLADYTLLKLQQGADVPELRKWQYKFITNYEFDRGFLKAFGVGGAFRWYSPVVIGYPINSAGQFELNNPYWGPSENGIDFWVSYHRKITDKVNWRIQLNIKNAFARNGLIPVSIEPDGHTWATVRVRPVQEWYLTNTFSF